jgi:Leucine-rich repeat (LRR) protein
MESIMKTLLSFVLILAFLKLTHAQTTAIPDSNFEQALIALGYDMGPLDGLVTTANISNVTFLNIDHRQITDLTGIEDFTSLTHLYCYYNQLTYLDFSHNYNLTILSCYNNQLTNLNITQNTALTSLICDSNQLTYLDVTQNENLTNLHCHANQLINLDVTQNSILSLLSCMNNQITSLDITQNTSLTQLVCLNNQLTTLNTSQNPNLTLLACDDNQLSSLNIAQNSALNRLFCSNNSLSCLNVKNGNNINFTDFSTNQNQNLTCVEVDDVNYSITNWTNIDAQTSFSTSCSNPCFVGLNEYNLSNFNIYPNPVLNQITIDTELAISNVSISDLTGKTITIINKKRKLLDVSPLPSGIYFIKIITEENTITKKFVKQ